MATGFIGKLCLILNPSNLVDLDKIVFAEKFKDHEEALLDLLQNFDQRKGVNVGDGDRNVIKAFAVDGFSVNVKSFKVPNLINKVVYRFFRKSKAERSYSNASKLLQLGIGTPQPIGFLETYQGPFFYQSYYLSEQLDVDFTFRSLIHSPSIPKREEIIRKFIHFTHKLHENGVLFKDHSPGNTLIKWEGDEVQFYLVDLNRMEFRELNYEERITNFSRLTPLKEMIQIMSEEYAPLIGRPYEEVFTDMWGKTEAFQYRFHRKKRLKKKLLFWK